VNHKSYSSKYELSYVHPSAQYTGWNTWT